MKLWDELTNAEKSIRSLWVTPFLVVFVYFFFVFAQNYLISAENLSRRSRRRIALLELLFEILSPLGWAIVFLLFNLGYAFYYYRLSTQESD